ncbi:MAG TPA: DUF6249 domain-containing protein [Vicinamibacterales bacterium]|nr:DUF6249 domain-containing protein [Vicinamibacterales bacterium]
MGENIAFIIPAIVLLGGFGFVYAGIYSRMKARELAHRERLAMIERGLVPPPESDPKQLYASVLVARAGTRSSRQRSAGVLIVGLGLGLMMIISFVANDPQIGLGVGGAVTIFGAAMLVNAHLGRDETPAPAPFSPPPPPPTAPPSEPPRG